MKDLIKSYIDESIDTKQYVLKAELGNIESAVKAIADSLKNGGKLLVFGNGGSASDSQHIVAELVGRFKKDRKALAAIALTANTSTLTAIGNDYGYDATFSRQVEALGKKGDVAMGISTSGRSKNVVDAVIKARSLGLTTICLTGGEDGGRLGKVSDISILVKSLNTPRIQESHIMIGHIICELVEKGIVG